jgi:hypothetical protein
MFALSIASSSAASSFARFCFKNSISFSIVSLALTIRLNSEPFCIPLSLRVAKLQIGLSSKNNSKLLMFKRVCTSLYKSTTLVCSGCNSIIFSDPSNLIIVTLIDVFFYIYNHYNYNHYNYNYYYYHPPCLLLN